MSGVRRGRACAAGVLVTLLLAGCGVEAQRAPEPVPADRLPSAGPSTPTEAASVQARVWGAREGRLVPVYTELTGTGTAARVRAVLALAGPQERPPTALLPGTRLLRVERSGDQVVLSLSEELQRVQVDDLPLVLGQLVLTVTEQAGVRRVRVRAGQDPFLHVDASGEPLVRPLLRSDFVELAQGGDED